MSLQQDMIGMTGGVELAKYPILTTSILDVNDGKETITLSRPDIEKSRETFLIEYYKQILKQHLIILGLFIFGLMEWFANIVVDFGYYDNSFRWTFYTFAATLIIFVLGLPIIRSIRAVVKYQNCLFNVQTVLIGMILIGIGNKSNNNDSIATIWWIIITLLILIGHSISQLLLIKHNITHYYTIFMKCTIMGSIILNLIVGLYASSLNSSFPIFETIIIYSIYYFNQLNQQLLKNPNELPEDISTLERIQFLNYMEVFFNQEAQPNQLIEQIQNTHCVFNRRLAILISSVIAYSIIFVLSIKTGNALFIVIIVFVSISILSLILNTQVASRTLQYEDITLAVCLTYLDLANPLKNIMNGIISKL